MLKAAEIRRQVAQRLRELLPKAKAWEESTTARIGSQTADLLVKFRLAEQEHTLVVEVSSLGQPRQIRAAVARLAEVRRDLPAAHPVAAAVYIGPQSARILKSNNLGFVDLSGNCYLAFDNVLIEKEGKRNVRPSTRPLRSLFAPRATRVVRVLLLEPGRAWRLEELARAAEVSLGHAHNVVKRLEQLAWVERDANQKIRLAKPADLLESWCESYTYRTNEIASYVAPGRSGCARRPRRTARCTSWRRTIRASSTAPWRRAASRSSACRSSTRISSAPSGAGGSRTSISAARRWATDRGREVNPSMA